MTTPAAFVDTTTSTDVPSPFLSSRTAAQANSLAIIHLRRDLLIPTILRAHDDSNEGYSEGKVTNTRFGSFPHSTLIGVPWGSQVRASAVDTGSRGRRGDAVGSGKKRKRGLEGTEGRKEVDAQCSTVAQEKSGDVVVVDAAQDRNVDTASGVISPILKAAVTASSGFVHLLPPTPEVWTSSLPHRTQVVYTPDYSYILHRIRARPGSVLIEAGAGSGSFTHAAARAVFNGYSSREASPIQRPRGKVWSYEFHEQRFHKLKEEISEHGLEGVIEITHKDVCQDGFSIDTASPAVNATAIFLDLPAPWLALRHLIRKSELPPSAPNPSSAGASPRQNEALPHSDSVLDPKSSIYLCTFSPCIEQVQRTITTLRKLGWRDIETVELSAKRLETKRERVGLQEEGLRGVNASPASVDEAVARLREVEGRSRVFHSEDGEAAGSPSSSAPPSTTAQVSKQQRLGNIRDALEGRKLYKEGRLVHRLEPELKMHTSYLVFAILPREWSVEDESAAQEKWPGKAVMVKREWTPMSKRQMKKAAKAKAGGNKEFELQQEEQDDGNQDSPSAELLAGNI
ncbi:tRNA (adenine-N(1)-)-methyltransferase catalytic subunit trm61 [Pseudocyphellaria aurata]|nr:tRNA (adenine-N(1)-)-methyltransferase catalytic subunit trm61 [Pseudocyphellaria aurata]